MQRSPDPTSGGTTPGRATVGRRDLLGFGVLVVAVVMIVLLASPTRVRSVEVGGATEERATSDDGASRATEEVTYRDELELVGMHLVDDGTIAVEAGPAAAAVWATAAGVLPDWAVAEIRQLNLVTDGRNGTLAMVHRSTLDADGWILSLDPAEDTAVLEETLVHELAHMLTLKRDELTTGSGDCEGVRVELGCARDGSALAEWATEFWPDGDIAKPHETAGARTDFASDYAASAVHEDLAESFLRYVTGPSPAPGTLLARKVAFFDAYPELKAAAADVRTRLHAS